MILTHNLRLVKYRKKHWLALLFMTSCFIVILIISAPNHTPAIILRIYYWLNPDQAVSCHYLEPKDSLPDISDFTPKKGQSIFFHETSCNSFINGKITITSRQACAVESAAKMNPGFEVYLLYTSPGKYVFENTESDRFLKELLRYPNVHILHLDLRRYFRDSPVENLLNEGRIKESHFAQSHTSDVLRYLTLWKYGGIYLDLDVIVTKSFEDLESDFSGAESLTAVAAGIVGFAHTGDGHKLATNCLEDLKYNFKGYDWGWNGPGTITRLALKLCQADKVSQIIGKICKGFKIYPPSQFYSIPWRNWRWFFESKFFDTLKESTNSSYIIHVWNKHSSSTKIELDSGNVPYLEVAKKFCPNVVSQCDEYF